MAKPTMNYRGGNLLQGSPMPRVDFAKILTADDQVLNPNKGTLCDLQSDNTTATNRTFTILDGKFKGQGIILNFVAGSSYTCDLQSAGNVSLSEAWQPLQYECIELMWNGTDLWVEVNRSLTGLIANSIVNADVNASAAIAYSKLNLAAAVTAADFSVNSGALMSASFTVTFTQLNAAGDGVALPGGGSIPDNSVIVKAWYHVKTTFSGDGDDSSLISIGIEDQDNDLVAAAAIKTGTPWDAAVPVETLVSDFDDPTKFIILTAARQIAVTVDYATTDVALDAGEMTVTCLYIAGV